MRQYFVRACAGWRIVCFRSTCGRGSGVWRTRFSGSARSARRTAASRSRSRASASLRISGDPDDVLSRGYICPKAAALADIQSDPDRLRRPVKKLGGRFVEIGWDEALDLAAEGLRARAGGRTAPTRSPPTLGNPSAHSSAIFAAALVRKVLGTQEQLLGDLDRPAAAVHELA